MRYTCISSTDVRRPVHGSRWTLTRPALRRPPASVGIRADHLALRPGTQRPVSLHADIALQEMDTPVDEAVVGASRVVAGDVDKARVSELDSGCRLARGPGVLRIGGRRDGVEERVARE